MIDSLPSPRGILSGTLQLPWAITNGPPPSASIGVVPKAVVPTTRVQSFTDMGKAAARRVIEKGSSAANALPADPVGQFEQLVDAFTPRAKDRREATAMAVRACPAAHRAYLAAVNAGRPASFFSSTADR